MYKIKLSPYHKIFYNEWKLNPESFKYNIVFDQTISSNLNISRLRNALNRFVTDYLLFNSHIIAEDNELYWIKNEVINELEYFNSTHYDPQHLYDFVTRPFDLENKPLYRFGIFENNTGDFRLIIIVHHIIMDGGGVDKFILALSDYYNHAPYKFHLNSDMQAELITSTNSKLENNLNFNSIKCKQFWDTLLSEVNPADFRFLNLNNPYLKDDLDNIIHNPIKEINFKFFKVEIEQLNHIARKYAITPYLFSLCVFALLSHRYTNQNKLAISFPIAIKESVPLIYGSAVNTNFILYNFTKTTTVIDLFDQTKSFFKTLKNGEYNYYPVYKILENTSKELFNIVFAQTNLKHVAFNFVYAETLKINNEFNVDLINNFVFEQEIRNHSLTFRVKYDVNKVDIRILKNFIRHYKRLFSSVLSDLTAGITNKPINQYQILDQKEYNKIIYKWNQTQREFPYDKMIHELFEEQVRKTPENIALVYENIQVTYKELNQRVNQLAHYINKIYLVMPDDLIVLYLDINEYIITSILAILKSGAAYVPIDTNQPLGRINYILKDTKAKLLITNNCHYTHIETILTDSRECSSPFILNLDSKLVQKQLTKELTTNPLSSATNKNLAYVIYTSGTTGNPKGVMIEHKNVVSLVKNVTYISISEQDKFILLASIAFDAATFEMWMPLLNGSCLFVPANKFELISSAFIFKNYLVSNEISVLWLTKTIFDKLYNSNERVFSTLKYLLVGGEVLDKTKISKLYNSKCRPLNLINGYGPTENTTFSTSYKVIKNINYANSIPIGKPLTNRTCYILDNYLHPLPIGAVGELYVGGAGVARGYLNNQQLTAERFIPNPFCSEQDKQNANNSLLFKTGDMVRYLPDGNIEYIGRNDFQTKIRGYRVELKEIEAILCKYPGIKQVVVLACTNRINNFLNQHNYKTRPHEIDNKSIVKIRDNNNIILLETGMLPIQEWLFAQNLANINHWNQSFLMKAPKLNRTLLLKSLTRLISLHDCFRLCFKCRSNKKKSTDMFQYHIEFLDDERLVPLKLHELDISQLPYAEGTPEFDNEIHRVLTTWQSDFDIENGYLSSFGYIYGYKNGSTRVYFALHHLIVDVVSWHILVYDLQKIYTELSALSQKNQLQEQISSLKKDYTSYRQWINIIKFYAEINIHEKGYWLNILSGYKEFNAQLKLLVDNPKNHDKLNKISSSKVTFRLGKNDSYNLTNGNNFNNRINSILLSPVVVALKELLATNLTTHRADISDTVHITLEGHGREDIATDVDITHTIGWFTTMYPVKLRTSDDLITVLNHTQSVLQEIPNNGIGYGALFGYKDLPKISFNFLGQLNKFAAEWSITDEPSGKNIDDKNIGSNVIDIIAYIINGQLTFSITSQLKQGLLNQFVTILKTNLITLINIINQGYKTDTPTSNKYLVAYYVSAEELNPTSIREYLYEYLSQYSIPSMFIPISAIPLTLNGKIDIKALPQPDTLENEKYVAPYNEKEYLICTEFNKILNKPQIGIYDDFFACGGDSISAINLVRFLQYHFSVNVRDIYNYRTPYKLAQNIQFSNNSLKNRLLSIIQKDMQDKAGINYEITNNNLKTYLNSIKKLSPDISNKKIKNVLLTGATGFLGCNILNQLLTSTKYNIYVLVRAESDLAAIERVKYKYKLYFTDKLWGKKIAPRLFIYCADLEKRNFGFSEAKYVQLVNTIDSIIHAAALVKQIGDYETFYDANVQATTNLLDFTNLTTLKDFHYISTMSVLKHTIESNNHWGSYYPEELQPDNLQLSDSNIYLRTKLEAERQVFKYREYGLNTNIYRVGNLAFMSENCTVQENTHTVGFTYWLKYFLHTKVIFSDCKIEISPVDITAEAIVKLFDKQCSLNNIYHVCNPHRFDLNGYLQLSKKLTVQVVSEAGFIKHVINELETNTNTDLLLRFLLAHGWLDVEGMYQFLKRIYLQDKTQYILKYLGFEWVTITQKQFSKYLDKIL